MRRKLRHTPLGRDLGFESLYLENFYCAFDAQAACDSYMRHWNARSEDSSLARTLYADQKTYLVELLMKQDQMSMAASIESRVPFLDHTLVEFAARIPDGLKIRGRTQKYILKQAVRDLLPRDIIYRKKMGFPTPLRQWLLDPRAEPLYAALRSRNGLIAEYLDPREVEALIQRHRSGREDATDRIWRLLNLQLWGDMFITGRREQLLSSAAASRMKILWVNSDFLHPTTRGGQIRTLEMLKRLHLRHEIHYAALLLPSAHGAVERSVEYCTKAYPVPHQVPADFTAGFFRQIAESQLSKIPMAVLRYRSNTLRRRVESLTRSEKFDAIVCDFLSSSLNIPDLGTAILFQHNVESMIWKRHAENGTGLMKIYFQGQYDRMLGYEGRVCQAVKRIVAVSEDDARSMQSLYRVRDVAAVPTGVDIDHFAPPQSRQPTTDLVFLGSMDWRPNIDGVRWFASEILPLIRRRRPECSLTIAGRLPTPEILRLAEADPRIHVTGTVPDVRPYLWESAVSIVPLRVGGGTRLKIYEAMAARIPVVSTTIGAEGLDVRDGENIALADSPEAFAERCLALLGNAGARSKQAQAAWEMVSACYSWEVAAREFEQVLF